MVLYEIFYDSTRPHPPYCTIQSHHWLHLEHQEAQESHTSWYLVEMGSLDGLFQTNMHGIVCFWYPWHQTHLLRPFRIIIDSIWTIKKLMKVSNLDIWRIWLVLMDFLILIRRVWHVFGILVNLPTNTYYLESLLTLSWPSGSSGRPQIWIFEGNK